MINLLLTEKNLQIMKDYYTHGPGHYVLNNKAALQDLLVIDGVITKAKKDILILIDEVARLTKIISESGNIQQLQES